MRKTIRHRLLFWPIIGIVMIGIVLMVSVIDRIYPIDTGENGFLEIAGLILLIVMMFAWFAAAVTAFRSDLSDRMGFVAVFLMFSAISFGAAGRETTWGKIYGLDEATVDYLTLTSAIIFLIFFIISITLICVRLRGRRAFFWNLLTSHPMGWIICGLVLFVIGTFFEENIFGIEPHQLFEEALELLAYLSVAIAAFAFRSAIKVYASSSEGDP